MSGARLSRHWRDTWLATFGFKYEVQEGDRAAFAQLFETFGREKGELVITALLTAEELRWVDQRRPTWLANPRNHVYFTRFITTGTSSAGGEWTKPRAEAHTTTIRSFGRAARCV